jgi:hypothetical protein
MGPAWGRYRPRRTPDGMRPSSLPLFAVGIDMTAVVLSVQGRHRVPGPGDLNFAVPPARSGGWRDR